MLAAGIDLAWAERTASGSCNSVNTRSPRRAGVVVRERLEALGWHYDDGRLGPSGFGRRVSECYPYTTLAGVGELGYDSERPRYKRKPKSMRIAEFRPLRAATCDELVARLLRGLATAHPPLDLRSHPETARLADEHSPLVDGDYKHREDLIDAALCAWTAALWHTHGTDRCQVLGEPEGGAQVATIIAPARPEQRRERESL